MLTFSNKTNHCQGFFVIFLLFVTTEAVASLMKKSNWNLTLQSRVRADAENKTVMKTISFHQSFTYVSGYCCHLSQYSYLPNHCLQSKIKGLFHIGTHTASVTAQHILTWTPSSLKLKRISQLASFLQKSKTWLMHTEKWTNIPVLA